MDNKPDDLRHSDLPDGEVPQPLPPNDFGQDTRGDFRVLKDGDLFAVFAASGDMNGSQSGAAEIYSKDGLFFRDTRLLSRFVLTVNETQPVPLSAHVDENDVLFRCDMANGRLLDRHGEEFSPYQIHILRERFLNEALYESVTITNHGLSEAALDLVFDCHADFRDIFEVRGASRKIFGKLLPPRQKSRGLVFSYLSSDNHHLTTDITFDTDALYYGGRAHISIDLKPAETRTIQCTVRVCETESSPARVDEIPGRAAHGACDLGGDPASAADSLTEKRAHTAHSIAGLNRITTDNPEFNAWLRRSASDLTMLTADLPSGPYPHAGVPWFSVPFGRDGIIAALQTLWLDSRLAAGVLDFLAQTQATHVSRFRDAEPGKILHETRGGEMARLGEVPFESYYGGVDQTLLFIILAGAYFRQTRDLDRIRRLMPAIRAALQWAREFGDRDGDGFIEYQRHSDNGLRNQGWKDSDTAIFHADGTLGEGPIALVEVQGYYFAALGSAAEIMTALGAEEEAEAARTQAAQLYDKIDRVFWDDELRTYCIGLDGAKQPFRVSTSNAGHLLFADAVPANRAPILAETLLDPLLFTGWGLRTVASGAARFNPMNYHNGSIWPHDNSLIIAGLARNGFNTAACRMTDALFDASREFSDYRLPELWCGFERDVIGTPVAYPSACSPQAWAAGAPFLCLKACLGIEIDPADRVIHHSGSVLPTGVNHLTVSDLSIGSETATLTFCRHSEASPLVDIESSSGSVTLVHRDTPVN